MKVRFRAQEGGTSWDEEMAEAPRVGDLVDNPNDGLLRGRFVVLSRDAGSDGADLRFGVVYIPTDEEDLADA